MPTVAQSEWPKPKSWDEFEDIVWDLYLRLWDDPNAQRYGRPGQAQQGVDIYGQPTRLGGRYAGVQCKRYDEGALTRAIVEGEVAKAEEFSPPLAEYTIATTERRNARLQAAVREINRARQAAGKFSIQVAFWDDLCSWLSDPSNNDLLQKHYGDWLARLAETTRISPLGPPFQAPPLPPYFVPRPEVTDAVRGRLLTDDPTGPGVLVVSAIQGLGGIGKSVLAAALAHDGEVRRRFPDGILWATLGQRPEILSLLSTWIQALGDYDFHPIMIDAASAHLRTLLHERAVLLIVDDAWDPAHVLPFRVGGPHCHVLVTTRRADVADELGAHLYQVDVMTPEQSLVFLSVRLERPLPETERRDAHRLARAVGYLPLALELVAARVARGVSWSALLQDLEQEIARLETLESPRDRRRGQLRLVASLNLSLEALRAEDGKAWGCFVRLGVPPEDVIIATPMAATLWGVGGTQASEMLELLWSDALLTASAPVQVEGQTWPGYRLHDLLHDLARRLLVAEAPQGLGLTLAQAHASLLRSYWSQTQDELWHTLPDDGYIHTHLTWHMERAGWADSLHALLREETAQGRSGWYEVREGLGQAAGYLADVGRAWRLAQAQSTAPNAQIGTEIGLQCRYALIVASLNSLAKNMPPALLAMLVQEKMWSLAQGLAYARQVSDAEQQVEALVRLAPHLTEPLREEALVAALGMQTPWRRAEALAELAPYLPEPLLWEALAAARVIESEYWRAIELVGLAPYLPEPLLREALAAARAIKIGRVRAKALAGLAAHLSEVESAEVVWEALAATETAKDEYWQREAIVRLAIQLPQVGYIEALREAIPELAPYLSKSQLVDALQDMMRSARMIREGYWQGKALAELIPHLAELGRPQDALAAARAIESEYWQAKALTRLAPYLPAPLLPEALTAARAIETEWMRAEALAGLAPRFPGPLLQEALAAARVIGDADDLVQDLLRLLPYLSAVLRVQWTPGVLTAARAIKDEQRRANALVELAPHLPEAERAEALGEALAAARAIKDEQQRTNALGELASHLPEPERAEAVQEALVAAQAIGTEYGRTETLAKLALLLAELGHPREALVAARAIEGKQRRTDTLAELARSLVERGHPQEALAAARAIKDGQQRASVLTELASHLPGAERA